jgi:hypothetical protein
VQSRTNLVRIGAIGRRHRVGFEQFSLRLVFEQVLLGGSCHGLRGFHRFLSVRKYDST